MAPGKCFSAAIFAADAHPELWYCEGYATTGFGYPFVHGWCEDAAGVVELTCPDPKLVPNAINARTMMPYLPRERWGYIGVRFTRELAHYFGDGDMADTGLALPLIDRGRHEQALHAGQEDYTSPHDYPILKLPYDPNRTTI